MAPAIKPALTVTTTQPSKIDLPIKNFNRCVGTMLSGEIATRYGDEGLPENTVQCSFKGTAGQSFGAFLSHGVTLTLEGDANGAFKFGYVARTALYTTANATWRYMVVAEPPAGSGRTRQIVSNIQVTAGVQTNIGVVILP